MIVFQETYKDWPTADAAAEKLGKELHAAAPRQKLHARYYILPDGRVELTIKQTTRKAWDDEASE